MLQVTPKAAYSPFAAICRLALTQVFLEKPPFAYVSGLKPTFAWPPQKGLVSKAHSGARRKLESRVVAPGPARSQWESREDTVRLSAGQSFYVTCHPGLEEVVAAELTSQNIRAQEVVPGKAGVFFRCKQASLFWYTVVVSNTSGRVMLQGHGRCRLSSQPLAAV